MTFAPKILTILLLLLPCIGLNASDNQSQPLAIFRKVIYSNILPSNEIWRFDPTANDYKKILEFLPLTVDKNYYDKWQGKGLFGTFSAQSNPAIADVDNDGQQEIIIGDTFGISIYGKNPAYYAFPEAAHPSQDILVADVNGDGAKEILTQRHLRRTGVGDRYTLEIWKIERGRLIKIWEKQLFQNAYVLLFEDADNDGQKELITAADSIMILKRKGQNDWQIVAELPNIGLSDTYTMIDVVRIADVDSDGKNEILACGNSGLLTIYKHRKQREWDREIFPVLWQSPPLVSKDLTPAGPIGKTFAFTQGLGVGDLDGDGKNEICVGTIETGNKPDNDRTQKGKIHIFKCRGEKDFEEVWVSAWTRVASIPAFALGDVDGDGKLEFVYDGFEIYGFDATKSTYVLKATMPNSYAVSAVGHIPEVQEPSSYVRIIPVKSTLPSELNLNRSYQATFTLRSVWRKADDVSYSVRSEDKWISVKNAPQKLESIEAGGYVDTQPVSISVSAPDSKPDEIFEAKQWYYRDIWIDIAAKGGYKQSIPVSLSITLPEKK